MQTSRCGTKNGLISWANATWFLLNAPSFDEGNGLLVHVRTTKRYDYSFISSAAIKLGEDTLQINSWGEYSLNGVVEAEIPTHMADRYTVSRTLRNKKQSSFVVDLGEDMSIRINVFRDLVAVQFEFGSQQSDKYFQDSVGLMGEWKSGTRWARDGVAVVENNEEFGQEWQVRGDEPKLFLSDRDPIYPAQCQFPTASDTIRRLGEQQVSFEEAKMACSHLQSGAGREACIHDVIAVGDLSLAQSGVY